MTKCELEIEFDKILKLPQTLGDFEDVADCPIHRYESSGEGDQFYGAGEALIDPIPSLFNLEEDEEKQLVSNAMIELIIGKTVDLTGERRLNVDQRSLGRVLRPARGLYNIHISTPPALISDQPSDSGEDDVNEIELEKVRHSKVCWQGAKLFFWLSLTLTEIYTSIARFTI